MSDENNQICRPELEQGTVIDRYCIKKLIGAGAFGNIYSVSDIEDNDKLYAMKIIEKTDLSNSNDEKGNLKLDKESKRKKSFYDIAFENPDFLENEILYALKDDNGMHFPNIVAEGKISPDSIYNNEDNNSSPPLLFIVMTLFGPSLGLLQLFMAKKRFTPFTSTKVAMDTLNCIQVFHDKGYVHNDIKPGNFLVQANSQSPIVLIDFGLSIKYLTQDTSKDQPNSNSNSNHIKMEKNLGFTGTIKYASINAHHGILLSRRDDLYSWFYSILELATGDVPWGEEVDYDKTLKMKKNVSKYIDESVKMHYLPAEFKIVYKYITSLSFEERPNYDAIRGTLRNALKTLDGSKKNENNSYAYHKYDWELLDRTSISTISDVKIDVPKPCFSYSPYYQSNLNENDNGNENNNTNLIEEGDLNDIKTEGGCHACNIC